MQKVTSGSSVVLPRYFHVQQILGLILLFLGLASLATRFESQMWSIFPGLANLWVARSLAGLGILTLLANGYRLIIWANKRRSQASLLHASTPDQPNWRAGKTDASLFLPSNRPKVLLALLVTSPILLAILPTIQGVKDQSALRDHQYFQTTLAEVVETRETPGRHSGSGVDARYRFEVPSHSGWFAATDSFGRSDLWVELSQRDKNGIAQGGRVIKVKYLPENPAANEPYDVVGSPYADNITGAGLVLFLSTLWSVVAIGLVRRLFKPKPREK